MENKKDNRINFIVSEETKKTWKIEAITRNMSLTDLIKEAVREKLEREKESK